MYYIILDMEWNQALDRAHTVEKPVLLRGEIIQIGAVKCDEDFNLVDRLKINVAPKYYKKMNRHVEKITGQRARNFRRLSRSCVNGVRRSSGS